MRAAQLLVLGFVLTTVSPEGTAASESAENPGGPENFDACDALVAEQPERVDSYYCFRHVAAATGEWQVATLRLQALIDETAPPRARHVLAMLQGAQGLPRAVETYDQAAEEEAEVGDWTGAARSRLGRAFLLGAQGRLDEAEQDLIRAREVLPRSDDPMLRAGLLIGEGVLANRRSDYGRARGLFLEAEGVAFPDGDAFTRSGVLSGLGFSSWAMGDIRGAMDYYRREAELLREQGNLHREASPRYNAALMAGQLSGRDQLPREEVESRTREALDVALRSGNRAMEASCRRMLGQALGGEEGIEEFRRAQEIATETGDVVGRLEAQRFIAAEYTTMRAKGERGKERRQIATTLAEQATAEARDAGRVEQTAYGLILRAGVESTFGDPLESVRRYELAQDQIEKLRDLQPEGNVRAGVLSRFSHAYYRPAGILLQASTTSAAPHEEIGASLQILERLRARTLLDRMDEAGVSLAETAEAGPLHRERDRVLKQIAEVQLLMRAGVPPSTGRGEGGEHLASLDRLEQDEAVLRDRIARLDPRFAALRSRPRRLDLSELQAALGEDEAILSFQLWYRARPASGFFDEGGSWVVVLTRSQAKAFEIPDRDRLREQIAVFGGLLARRDDSEKRAASILYRDLLADALSVLPAGIRRLTIVPDSHLYHLPFGALRSSEEDAPLAARYRLAMSPSLSTWIRWRNSPPRLPTPASVLAIADPTWVHGGGVGEDRSAGPWMGMALGALPHTRREAAAAVAGIGGRLVMGPDASEAFLKRAPLEDHGLLYFAAHAVVDDGNPERSAIILSPGDAGEDGLLQVREIVDLPLSDHVVVLSTCRSASGRLIEGEGVLNLARAFFLAGARTVVGTHYPMRDDETAALMEGFGKGVGRGLSPSEALQEAQLAQIRAGAPTMAWAGMTVLGDGDVIPAPSAPSAPGRWSSGGAPIPIRVVVALLVLVLLGMTRPFRRWQRRPPRAREG